MFEVYIHEAHAGENLSQYPEFAQFDQPKTMEDRIEIFDFYRRYIDTSSTIDIDTIIIPTLIDSINRAWENKYSKIVTDGFVIGADCEIKEKTGFLTGTGQMTRIEETIEEELAKIDCEPPEVEVTSPSGGEELKAGTTHDITWTATDNTAIECRSIYLTKDGSTWELLDSSDDNTGTFSWTIPSETSYDCKIKVYAYDAMTNTGNDESDVFSIGMTSIIFNLWEANQLITISKNLKSYSIYIPFSANYTVAVSDMQGKQVTSFTTSQGRGWYRVPGSFSSGMHIVSIRTPEKTIVKKSWFVR